MPNLGDLMRTRFLRARSGPRKIGRLKTNCCHMQQFKF